MFGVKENGVSRIAGRCLRSVFLKTRQEVAQLSSLERWVLSPSSHIQILDLSISWIYFSVASRSHPLDLTCKEPTGLPSASRDS